MTRKRPAVATKADQYRLPDGTIEIIFAVEAGRVLTFREYPSADEFRKAVTHGIYFGTHDGVAALPGIEAFRNDM